MKRLLLLLIVIIIGGTAIGQIKNQEELQKITTEILTTIKKESIVTDSIDWKKFVLEISTKVSETNNMDSISPIFYAIFSKLRQYGDYHSFYYSNTQSKKIFSTDTSLAFPSSKIIDDSIGYLFLPKHMSMNKVDNFNYADSLRKQIEFLDTRYKIKGWIVDLRENRGGNMWPMVAGLNPIVNDGIVGYFVSKKSTIKWESNSRRPMNMGKMALTYKCKNLNNKIAILIDSLTASSGEMTAISLLGMNNSKSFGRSTSGYTTANGSYKLSNGAYLFLANSYCEDRTTKKYIGKIRPEIEVRDKLEILNVAKNWILSSP